jgi:hypothetical protein
MDAQGRYLEFFSQEDVRKSVLDYLQKLSTDFSLPRNPVCGGICFALSRGALSGTAASYMMIYHFIAAHSNGYEPFVKLDLEMRRTGGSRWEGRFGDFRRQWCGELAEKLKANPSLWNKLPTGY